MIKLIIYLIFVNSFESFNWWQPYSTSVYANNYLYVFDKFREDQKSGGITKYSLKDGPITELKNEYFNLWPFAAEESSIFIDIPDDFKNKLPKGDKTWLFTCNNSTFNIRSDDYYPKSQILTVDDESRSTQAISGVEFPYSGNMTQSAYGITRVREGDSLSIYLYGGIANNAKFSKTVVTNSFFKYESKANKWTDLSFMTTNERNAAFHKAVNVDDKYIYMLGGIYIFSDYLEKPMMPINYTMFYNNFQTIRRYDLSKKEFQDLKTSSSGSLPVDLLAGRYGFSATYHKGKIYVYGGIQTEKAKTDNGTSITKEILTGYLGVLDIETRIWEWYQPKEPNGEKSNRKLAFHDSVIWNNQLLLTHPSISDDNANKYKLHAIDLDTKNFSDYIGLSPNAKSDDRNGSSGLPSYAIAIIAVAIILVILIVGYLVYRKRRNSKSKNDSQAESLQEVWATPQNAITGTRSGSNTGTGISGSTKANLTPLSTGSAVGSVDPDASKMTQLYMDLPYFQHEVDTRDTQADTLAKSHSSNL
ncbi:hypothetical protein CONCODRAFT_12616 [Conidiobolus coronatus NRRL 28638]|uniref:Galactose oxidase n=1 Tax=Conidiobolus coronatus (strain ATCC 28846 / CBS 209.66 / NRRL 28638) TaxID=796925 RepID=A0A137NSP0_CONC2|nr:hypothetical protein CONCODRAFT_12616 [Conidiobolus coronatus NRRL 28638]|eukprot:KXN65712.1 hypothetical protein CONCODRAFT_12616 [Conidiobolus coronatus NRRL 28638]